MKKRRPDRRTAAAVGDQYFYVLPWPLIESIESRIAPSPFADAVGIREKELSQQCHLEYSAGFRNAANISYSQLLPQRPLPIPPQEHVEQLGWNMNAARVSLNLTRINKLLAHRDNVARGYVGWLLSNPEFIQEHDDVVAAWAQSVTQSAKVPPALLDLTTSPSPRAAAQKDNSKSRNFLLRWRLVKLAGPELPVPMLPTMAGAFPESILPQLMQVGGLFHYPDTFPVPSRDELRDMLSDALKDQSDADHLAEWQKIIGRTNQAKNQITHYAVRRQLYHFWRLIQLRYRDKVAHRRKVIRECLAKFLGVTEMSVRTNLQNISQRLGPDWAQRPAPLTVTSL
jgi:hypothetical protein